MTIANLIVELLNIYSLLIIIRAILSWIQVNPGNQVVRVLRTLTDPVIIPIQRVIPPIGGTLDISPIGALLLIYVVKRLVISVFW